MIPGSYVSTRLQLKVSAETEPYQQKRQYNQQKRQYNQQKRGSKTADFKKYPKPGTQETSTQALICALLTALHPTYHYHHTTISYPYHQLFDRREDIPDLTASRKRFIVSSICSRYEIGESSTARPARGQGIDYGLSARPVPEIANLYRGEETVWMVEEEAYASREAWAHSIGLSQATHQELQTHRDHVYAYKTHLQAHQTQLQLQGPRWIETLRVIRDMRREMSDMQAELLALREQRRRARQSGPEARIPDHQEASW
ncbi:hypothetical protein Tco_0893863 [Tanacetum coccineum]|uniref:Uncharacterized protein n=1 Tax=Tanacetum coccineum TaxID=301880 RepID=A0ABQ5CDB2_9ASTR